ncbi:MAG TPA: hypothetical protein PK657_05665 [Legionella sp.]|nr:hypothetical protein [Legionella sp.]
MLTKHHMQKGLSDFSLIIGKGLKYGGAFSLLTMAVVGTVAVDLVLIAAAERQHNYFLTGFILGSMCGGSVSMGQFILSPVTSLIAVGLSVLLGVPMIGMALIAGWALAATVLGAGLGLELLGHSIAPKEDCDEYPSNYFLCAG